MTFNVADYPIDKIREQFPALKRKHNGIQATYFDGPGGSQTVQSAIDAMSDYLKSGAANLGGSFPTSIETEAKIQEGREYVAKLLNAKPEEVAFGQNATSMMFHVSRALSNDWNKGDNIVLTEMEHHANIDSWKTAAEDNDVEIRYIPVDPETFQLDMSVAPELIDENTKLVAAGSASNLIGTINDIKTLSKLAKEVGAVLVADAVHAVAHMYVDMQEMGIDIVFCSLYKMFGPHIGIAVVKKSLFEDLDTYKIEPFSNEPPMKLQTGTQNHEAIPAVTEAIKFIASLGTGDNIQEQIKSGYEHMAVHENHLVNKLRSGLREFDELTLYTSEGPTTPTTAFTVDGISPKEFSRRMAEDYAIFLGDGAFHAQTLSERLGVADSGGFIRAGISAYNTEEEVDGFLSATKEIIESL